MLTLAPPKGLRPVPSPRLSPKIARLFALQTAGTPVFLFLLWAFCLWYTRPNFSTESTGGIDLINTAITWTAFTFVFTALGAINLLFSRQLFGESKGERRGIESW